MSLRLSRYVFGLWLLVGLLSCGAPSEPIQEPPVQEPPVQEPGPKPPTALQPSGTPTEAVLEARAGGDMARFTFTATAGRYYRFTCTLKTLESCTAKVLDAQGTVLAVSTASAAESVVVLYRSLQAGPLFIEVSSASSAGGTYSYQLQDVGTDDAGNTPQEASPRMLSAEPFTGHVDSSGDADVYSFPATPGHIHRFSCSRPAVPAGGWIVRLRNARGQKIDELSSWEEPILSVGGKVQQAETWYAEILFVDDGFTGTYTCTLEDLGPDDHGDSQATASPLSADASVISGRFELRADVDAFALASVPGHYYSLTCSSTVWPDCQASVLGVTGEWFRRSNAPAIFYFKAPAAGPVLILLTATGETGTYSLQVQDVGLDDHGDSAASATPRVPSAEPIQGVIEAPIDRDVFAFTAEAGHVYQLLCEATPERVAWHLEIQDAAGTVLDTAPVVVGGSSVVSAEITTPGTYTVAIFGTTTAPRSGSYSCRLEDVGPDDHDDTLTAATAVTLPATVTGRWETRRDVDVFSFSAQAGHTYRVTCKIETYADPCWLRLKSASGTELLPSQQVSLQLTATADEPWFVELQGNLLTPWLESYVLELKEI
jgi:hypothetical protein